MVTEKFREAVDTVTVDVIGLLLEAIAEEIPEWALDQSSLRDTYISEDGSPKPITEDYIFAFNQGVESVKDLIIGLKDHI